MGFLKNLLGKRDPSRHEELLALQHLKLTDPNEFRVQKSEAAKQLLQLQNRALPQNDPELLAASNRLALFHQVDDLRQR